MTKKPEKIRDKRLISVMFIILVRFAVALLLSMVPIFFGLKSNDYVIYLIVLHFIFQFLWAIVSMRSYFREIKNIMSEELNSKNPLL
jgi:ABC-type glycerol-3-phosphate transport system permease component